MEQQLIYNRCNGIEENSLMDKRGVWKLILVYKCFLDNHPNNEKNSLYKRLLKI